MMNQGNDDFKLAEDIREIAMEWFKLPRQEIRVRFPFGSVTFTPEQTDMLSEDMRIV